MHPDLSQLARKTGSADLVMVTTIPVVPTAASEEATGCAATRSSRSTRLASESRWVAVGLYTRTASMLRTEQTAATWAKAWRPAPMMPSERACGSAKSLVANPLAAPVRIRPRLSASIIALSLPSRAQ